MYDWYRRVNPEYDLRGVYAVDPDHADYPPAIFPRVVKLTGSILFYVVWQFTRKCKALFGGRPKATLVVLYYHHLRPQHRDNFALQLDHLRRWTKPLAADTTAPLEPGHNYTIVTVDDGWKSFADNGIPQILKHSIPATLFVVSHKMGESIDCVDWDRLVNEDELKELAAAGVRVGSHSATHLRMPSMEEAEAEREMRESRKKLSVLLHTDVDLFSFPYGVANDSLASLARKVGYRRIFTCSSRTADSSDFEFGRVQICPTDWPLEFHLKILGAYQWVSIATEMKWRLVNLLRAKYKAYRHSARIPAA